ncbi:hypothetical protein WA1_41155 [Scytonema hofmannii PCC 7110]|uniref:DUF4328 domain-containing protein n=1 Tax=Scytonema hofmannii PCC 7110 TaxID=128403 RepID=A0A139WUP8_9CYAN|nr:hypothetical protein [Scytonema hofmannii]KYC36149.1 hypothetical protein WA1_41155 [Scytonema hofmannii PCC 7110]
MENWKISASCHSTGAGKLLMLLLKLRLGFSFVALVFSIVEVTVPSIYKLFITLDGLQAMVAFLVILSSSLVFLVWLHRFHADLKDVFSEYPITPWGAIARFVIPFYSLWGIWKTLSTFADRLLPEGGDLTSLSHQLRSCIPLLYAFTIISNTLGRIILNSNSQEQVSPWVSFSASAVEVCLVMTLLQLTKTMQTALAQKTKRALI